LLQDLGPAFEREYGCTVTEWRRWMPEAVHGHGLTLGDAALAVAIGDGRLIIEWQPLEPRRIALAVIPRLAVRFRYEGVEAPTRREFQRRFDLHLQRGGG
jgi:hypothetical protein